ncbi:PAS domain S-box protein [Oculatella sp. LEGE 06141]|uniref:PAS domain S-box protein n=1 Tax=Oculatella sp. LEGE 06141 TaxID=1828648 RepID=UPI001880E5E9|nr:PAS domain S-box protein [Oculatella sp. LEGE 06141]MBE9181698.1 PAS domain S-box protein [Oculatella sp. LEGE 06141]
MDLGKDATESIKSLLEAGLLLADRQYSLWKPEFVGLHVLSDALIALASCSIPLTLYIVRRQQDLPFNWVLLLFSAFLTANGATHLMSIWTIWHPDYWLAGAIQLMTATVSISTAVLLVPTVPKILALSTALVVDDWLLKDIAERQRIEAELIRTRDLREAIFNESADALFLVDPQTLLTLDCNRQAVDLFQAVDKTSLIGIEGHTLQRYPFSQDELNDITADIQSQGFWSREIEYVTCQGHVFWGNIAAKSITVAERMMHLVRVTDISDRKRAEQSLQEQEAFLRAIGDNIPNGYLYQLMREQNGCYRFTYVSAGIERASGLKPEAVIADSRLMFNLLVEDDLPYVIQKGEESARNLSLFDIQVRERSASGEIRWLRLCSTPRRLDDGRVIWNGIRLDINDLKQTEETLRQSEERWQLAISGSNDGIWDHNLQTNEHYLSPRCLELTGYGYNESNTFDKWLTYIHIKDVSRVHTTFQAHLEHRSSNYTCEYRMRCKDGSYKWLLAKGQALWDEQGNPLRAVGSLTDISDRKRAEEALQRYERIVSATTDAILLLDRSYVCQVVNQAYLNLHNKRQDDIIGRSINDIMPQAILNTIQPLLDQCLAGQAVQYELWADFAASGSHFLSITCDPYFDVSQTISGVVISLRNITRLKQAEMKLELQSIIVSNMAEGVCMARVADGIIVYANPKFEQMFGYHAGELNDQHVSIVNYGDGTLSAVAVNQKITEAVTQDGEVTYEIHNVKKDGTPFWCRATTSIFQHPQHGTVMVAVQQDITEQKRAEEQIKASLQEKEVLLKEIHHRVKNNLGIVDGLLQMQVRRSLDPQVVQTLKESQNRIASIALVHEKLYCSDDLANIDFSQYILDLTAHLFDSYNIHSKQIKLITQVDDVLLDIDRAIPCGLIINELVSNSLKHAFSTTQMGEIQVSLHQNQNQTLTLSVRDNGVGCPSGFDFNQPKTLGISLIQGLVKQLQGTLAMDAEQGTTFRITFIKQKK